MWTRSKLKEAAKAALHRNYWKIMLVSMILVLLGCETGGLTFHKTTYQTDSEEGVREMKSGSLPTGKRSIVTVRRHADSGKTTVETIGGGEFETDEVEISFLDGMFIGNYLCGSPCDYFGCGHLSAQSVQCGRQTLYDKKRGGCGAG